jgi:hypothetical protein
MALAKCNFKNVACCHIMPLISAFLKAKLDSQVQMLFDITESTVAIKTYYCIHDKKSFSEFAEAVLLFGPCSQRTSNLFEVRNIFFFHDTSPVHKI